MTRSYLHLTVDFLDQTSYASSPEFPSGRGVPSFTQVQIVGPTFNGLDMDKDHLSFRNFLSRFENCVAGMANVSEKLNLLKCSISYRPLLLINHFSVVNRNYQITLKILKTEYLNVDEIIQDISDYRVPNVISFWPDLLHFLVSW